MGRRALGSLRLLLGVLFLLLHLLLHESGLHLLLLVLEGSSHGARVLFDLLRLLLLLRVLAGVALCLRRFDLLLLELVL